MFLTIISDYTCPFNPLTTQCSECTDCGLLRCGCDCGVTVGSAETLGVRILELSLARTFDASEVQSVVIYKDRLRRLTFADMKSEAQAGVFDADLG